MSYEGVRKMNIKVKDSAVILDATIWEEKFVKVVPCFFFANMLFFW